MYHAIFSVGIQLLFILVGLNPWLAFIICTAYYLGREVAQAEHRVIKEFYGNKRVNAPWWMSLQQRAWTSKGLLDWILPALATACVAYFTTY